MLKSQIVPSGPEASRLGNLALGAALYSYALILFGGILRISGPGLENAHRVAAAASALLVLLILIYAWKNRSIAGFSGPGGLLRPIGWSAVLVVMTYAMGALTIDLDRPADVAVGHFVIALLLSGTLLAAAVRAGTLGGVSIAPGETEADARKVWRLGMATAGFGLIVLILGSMTASTPGAPTACTGFPLCSGSFGPPAGAVPSAHIHYTHRMLAYLLFFHVLGVGFAARKRAISRATRAAIVAAQAGVLLQVAVAAAMVTMNLAPHWQAMHLATGVAVWFALASWASLARRDVRATRVVSPHDVPHYQTPSET